MRALGVTEDDTTITLSDVSPPTAIRTELVPAVAFLLVILMASAPSKYPISPSRISVPTPILIAAFALPPVFSRCITFPATPVPDSPAPANVASASRPFSLPTENSPPRGCKDSGYFTFGAAAERD